MSPEDMLPLRLVLLLVAFMAIAFGLGWRTRKGR